MKTTLIAKVVAVVAAVGLMCPPADAAAMTTHFKSNLRTAGNLTVDGTSTMTGTGAFTGNVTVGGTLGVTGVATFTAKPVLSTATLSANGDTITIEDLGNANIVQSAGAQTVGGVKTFTSIPVLPLGGYTQTVTTPANNSTVKVANAIGQATVFTIPDPGAGTADFILSAGAQTKAGVLTLSSAPVLSTATLTANGDTISIQDLGNANIIQSEGAQTINGVKTFGNIPILPLGGYTQTATNVANNSTLTIANAIGQATVFTIPDPGQATANMVILKAAQTTAGELKREDLTEEALVVHSCCFATDAKELDGTALATTASAGKFGLSSTAAFGTPGVLELVGEVANSNTKTDVVTVYAKVPNGYIAGQSLNLQVSVDLVGAGTAGTNTIDANVSRIAADGTVAADLVTTAAQDLAASPVTRTFAMNTTDVVPGDILQITLQMIVQETGGANLNGRVTKVAMAYDIKG